MKNILLLVLFAVLTGNLLANSEISSDDWHRGEVLLKNGEILEGQVFYDHKHDVVQYLKEEKVWAFSPHKVEIFAFYDKNFEAKRVFKSMYTEDRHGYNAQKFFEVLHTGVMPIVGKLSFVSKQSTAKRGKMASRTLKRSVTVENYTLIYHYYVEHNGEGISFRRFHKDILPLVKNHRQEIEQYIEENNLHFRYQEDKLELVKYYNSLRELHTPSNANPAILSPY